MQEKGRKTAHRANEMMDGWMDEKRKKRKKKVLRVDATDKGREGPSEG